MEAAQRAEKFRLGGKSRFSDDGLNFEGTPPNNGFQLVIQAHIFHILVSVEGATSPHWGTKAALL